MNCSIVIRAYNGEKHIGRLLEGIKHQTVNDTEIILVDSGSTDRTMSVAESLDARLVRIPSDEFTFGRSLNFGVQAATRDVLLRARESQKTASSEMLSRFGIISKKGA